MGAATGPGTPGSSDAPGDCTPRCRRPPRPRRTTRQQTTTESTAISYGTAQAGAQTLAASGLRDFRVPFVPDTLSAQIDELPENEAGDGQAAQNDDDRQCRHRVTKGLVLARVDSL